VKYKSFGLNFTAGSIKHTPAAWPTHGPAYAKPRQRRGVAGRQELASRRYTAGCWSI